MGLDADRVDSGVAEDHCGASETSTLFIAIAYPPLVNVCVGELK